MEDLTWWPILDSDFRGYWNIGIWLSISYADFKKCSQLWLYQAIPQWVVIQGQQEIFQNKLVSKSGAKEFSVEKMNWWALQLNCWNSKSDVLIIVNLTNDYLFLDRRDFSYWNFNYKSALKVCSSHPVLFIARNRIKPVTVKFHFHFKL